VVGQLGRPKWTTVDWGVDHGRRLYAPNKPPGNMLTDMVMRVSGQSGRKVAPAQDFTCMIFLLW
jgi:hypothetical protein